MTRAEGVRPTGGEALPLGAVLCGGKSVRMGADKAGLEVGGRTLLELAVSALAGAASEVVLASGSAPRSSTLGLECVLDRRPDGGPLAGLEAALERAASAGIPWVLLLACDMPRARPGVFERLLSRARAGALDACLLETAEGLEPLCAVYRTSVLPAVRSALDAGERRMVAFHRGHGAGSPARPLRIGTLRLGALPPELAGSARNLNTPDELRREREEAPLR